MILDQLGQAYVYGSFQESLYIGQEIVANGNSLYVGLTGEITSIRSDSDMETENPGPDVYCTFDLESPQNAFAAKSARERLNLDAEITVLDEVIMAVDMLEPKMRFQMNPLGQQQYILTCFVNSAEVTDDYMLLVSHDHDWLKRKLNEHARENPHLTDKDKLWAHEEDTNGVYRLSFKKDGGPYVCYSIIPVDYEWRCKNAS